MAEGESYCNCRLSMVGGRMWLLFLASDGLGLGSKVTCASQLWRIHGSVCIDWQLLPELRENNVRSGMALYSQLIWITSIEDNI